MSEGKEVIAYAITHAPRGVKGGPYEGSGAYGFPAGSLRTACRWYNGRPAEYTMQAVRVVVPTARVIRIVRKARPSEASAVEVLRDMLATWDDRGLIRTEAFARARAVLAASGPDPMPVVRAAMAWSAVYAMHGDPPDMDLNDAVETYRKAGGK